MKPWLFVAGWLLLMAIVAPLVFRMARGRGFPGGPAPAEPGARLRA